MNNQLVVRIMFKLVFSKEVIECFRALQRTKALPYIANTVAHDSNLNVLMSSPDSSTRNLGKSRNIRAAYWAEVDAVA